MTRKCHLPVAIAIVLLTGAVIGCLDHDEDVKDDEDVAQGTLEFCGVLPTTGSRSIKGPCTNVDLRFFIERMQVSAGEINEGMTDDLDWHTIYTGDSERTIPEMDFSAQLPVGHYRNIRFEWRNWFTWLFEWNGTVQTKNESHFAPSDIFYDPASEDEFFYASINNNGGTWYYDGMTLYNVNPNERMGGFEIREGRVTRVKWRFNVLTVTWNDANANGVYDAGDSLSDYQAPPDAPSSTNMMDFIIEME